MKLFLDENLSPQHALELRTEGHDAIAVVEVGLSGATDEQVLRFAVESGRALVTLDADFANVMRFPPEQTLGIVRLKVHPATEERIRQVIRRAVLFLQNIDIRRAAGCRGRRQSPHPGIGHRRPNGITPHKLPCGRKLDQFDISRPARRCGSRHCPPMARRRRFHRTQDGILARALVYGYVGT